MLKKNFNPYVAPYRKFNSNRIIYINVKPKTIRDFLVRVY